MEPEQPSHRRSRWQRLLPAIVALVLAADVAAAVVAAVTQTTGSDDVSPSARSSRAVATPEKPRAPSPRAGSGSDQSPNDSGDDTYTQRAGAVRKLLATRARAVRTGDREAFLATVARGDPGFRAAQRQLFANLSRLPLAVWRYDLRPETTALKARGAPASDETPGARRSSGNVWTPHLVVHYRFAGFGDSVMSTSRYLTVAYGPRGWRVTDVAEGTDRSIWDLGDLRVVRGDQTLVLGLGTPRRKLQAIADHMERAIPVVTNVWGRHWSRRVVVLVPATQRQVRILSPDAGSLAQITAIATVAIGPSGVPPPGTGDRVIVNPANFSDLSALGRRVVLRHELTHVATRGRTNPTVPMWLVEGFADYVGYQGVDLPARSIARELGADVRSGQVPRRLPRRGDFAGTARHLTRAYEAAWLACEMVAQRHGEQRLVRLYRVMGAPHDGPSGQVRRRAMLSLVGKTPDEFTAAWRSYIRARLR